MKKAARIILTIQLLAAAAALNAFDYGLTLTNDSEYTHRAEGVLAQTNQAVGFFSIPTGPNSSFYASGLYEFSGSFGESSTTTTPWRFDLARTEFEGSVPSVAGPDSVLRYNVGRYAFDDFSGRIVSGLTDGVRADLSKGNYTVSFAGSYRGLLYYKDARCLIDSEDQDIYSDDASVFGPKRAVAFLGFRAADVIPDFELGLENYAQFDLESGTKTHTQYVEPFAEGRFGRSLRWRIWTVNEFGYDTEQFMAMAAGATLRYSVPEFHGFRVTQSVLWASGANGPFRAYTPIRQKQVATISDYSCSDVITVSLDFTLAPMDTLSLGLGGAAICRATTNSPSDALTYSVKDSSSPYLGSEASGRIVWKPASDFSFTVSGGAFIPNSAVYVSGTPLLQADVYASFTL